ncbi:MAG: chemotaxis protein CheC [Pseudomonadota bacterium]
MKNNKNPGKAGANEMSEVELNQNQLDALREIESIGAGNAATSLSVMLGRKVGVKSLGITMESIENVPGALGGAESVANVIFFSVTGRVKGSMLLILPAAGSVKLARLLTGGKAGATEGLSELELSALKELGNIMTGSYLSAMARFMKMKITYSIPGFACDMLGAVLDGVLARLSLKAGHAIIMESELEAQEDVHMVHLVFFPELEALQAILEALGVA